MAYIAKIGKILAFENGKKPVKRGKRKGVREIRHKLGKQAHKRGRPRSGSRVRIVR